MEGATALGRPDPSGGTGISGSQQTHTMDIKDYSSSKRVIMSRDTQGPILSPAIFSMSMKPFEEIGGDSGAIISFLSDSDNSISLLPR